MKGNKIIISVLLCVTLLFLSSCVTYTSFEELTTRKAEETTAYEYNSAVYPEATTAVVYPEEEQTEATSAAAELTTAPEGIAPPAELTTAPVVTVPPAELTTAPEITTAPSVEEDYASYTTKQIIDAYSDALRLTRAYSGTLSATKTESFDAKIKEAHPGGALTELLANNVVKLIGSEGQQTISFTGGFGVDNEGVNVPVLLPQKSAFALPEEGVASAEIRKDGDKTRIRLVLVPETVGMGQIPAYNAGAVGYLDTSKLDFKIVTLSRVDITYTGSVIDAVIREDGYIESVTYTIGMSTYAELSGMGISGYGTLEGAQTEKWQLNW